MESLPVNPKITLAVSAALMTMSVHSATDLSASTNNIEINTLKVSQAISVNKNSKTKVVVKQKFIVEKNLENKEYIYIVHLENDSVAMYDGGVEGLESTNPHQKFTNLDVAKRIKGGQRLDKSAPSVIAYKSFLESKQTQLLTKVSQVAASAKVVDSFKFALNGLAMRMLPAEAETVSRLAGVKFVERDKLFTVDTDTGPNLIGAPKVWDGTATASGIGAYGEGIIVGILDTGINTDNPSFADISGDGFDHTNPLGSGVYLGDCAGEFAALCNDKLIGIYSYPVITDAYDDTDVFPVDFPKNGEDYGGHGSHTAGTAIGNILFNLPEVLPELDANDSAGVETGFVYDRISGVAPRANVIAYQVCFGSPSNTDTYFACPGAAIAAGIESAIEDGIVDVLNYSISGGGFSWGSSTELAFLAARNTGIFVATSAGNGGPGASTTEKHAPWYTAVAASEHGREINYDKGIGEFTGGDATLEDITGVSNSGAITASIVYAGDFANANDPDGDSAQCLKPFPTDTFSGEIVVCDRGAIARVEKAQNVADGGAGGYVLANLEGSAASLNSDVYVVPGIHISSTNGDALKTWLASGIDHMATITASVGVQILNEDRVDVLAGFSSKGPGTTISTLTPMITGPGVAIYAAYSDEQYGYDVSTPAPSDFNYLSGTSMSSPHIAGSAALVKSAQPTWTADNIRSALAMTATPTVKKEDGVTAGDWFDMGSGRVQVDQAVASGLVMDETAANYENANPNIGGEPRSLNLPSITDNNCVGTCSWTRTVTATKAASWSVDAASILGGLAITVTPATFDLTAGQSQEVTVAIDAFASPSDVYSFGIVNFTAANSPDLHWPVAIVASNGSVPESVSATAKRNQDSYLLKDVLAVEITEFTATSYGLTKATVVGGSVAQDSDNSDFLDDLADGLFITTVDVPEGAKRLVVTTSDSTSPDLDLFVVIDANGDGIPTEDEIVATAATGSASERVDIELPAAGMYWMIVQNWSASAEDALDTFNLNYALVDGEIGTNLNVSAPSSIAQLTEFDIRMIWDLIDGVEGDLYFGAVDLGTSSENAGNLGLVAVDLVRGQDDVRVTAPSLDRLNPGDTQQFSVEVDANFTNEDRDYEVSLTLPVGVTVDETTTDAVVDGDTLTWMVTQPSLFGAEPSYRITTNSSDAQCSTPFAGGGYIDLGGLSVPAPLEPLIDGDDEAATFLGLVKFLGNDYNNFTISSNGFITLGNDVGSSWINQLLPDVDAPNAVIAPLWRDMFTDVAAGSGVRVASFGGGAAIVWQWDNMLTTYNGVEDRADFQVIVDNREIAGLPNLVFAYTDMTHALAAAIPTTIGYENAEGTAGVTTHYVGYFNGDEPIGDIGADAVNGALICFFLQPIADAPTQLSFTISVDEDNTGGPIQLLAMSSVTNLPGTVMVASEVLSSVQVEGAPQLTIGGDTIAALEVIELRELPLAGLVVEPNGDDFDITWVQVAGPAAVIAGNGLQEAKLIAPEVTEDSIVVLEMRVVDSNGNSSTAIANVVVKNNVAPTLSISAPASVQEGRMITVRATASDPEGDNVTFTINGVAGSSLTIAAPSTNSDTQLTFIVVASDGLNTTEETVSVTVTSKSGGSTGWITLLLLPLVWLRRRKTH
ncbi:MAG: subtilisin family serine protease [Glaciecola sp.]|jgi:subtilisin family serine protease